jgi:hypothetical protein
MGAHWPVDPRAGAPRLIAEAANPMGFYGLSFLMRTCVWVNGGAIVSADRSLSQADVRVAADRHKYPLGWRARGVDEESQAASALL